MKPEQLKHYRFRTERVLAGPGVLRPTPADVLRRLAEAARGEAFAFVERCEAEGDGGYRPAETLIGFGVLERIRIRRNGVEIEQGGDVTAAGSDPFEALRSRLSAHGLEPAAGALRGFRGGYLGALNYDCVRFVEPRLARAEGNLKRLAEDGEAEDGELILFRTVIAFDHLSNEMRVVKASGAAGGTSGETLDDDRLAQLLSRDRPGEIGEAADGAELDAREFHSMLGKERFMERVRELKEHIRAGDIFQAVLSERFSRPFSGRAEELFLILRAQSPAPYRFFIHDGSRALMGASPETLVRVEGRKVETHPIAGTRPLGRDREDARRFERQLRRSIKEKAEHLMLVDLARNDLGRIARPGSVRLAASMELKRFPGVMHLVSRVEAEIAEGSGPVDALKSCFPAGTLSGAPKIRAMELLSSMEPLNRGAYGGAVVVAGFDGSLDTCITIRSLLVEDGKVHVQAGAGIVFDSDPEKEYREVLNKTRAARRALAAFEKVQRLAALLAEAVGA